MRLVKKIIKNELWYQVKDQVMGQTPQWILLQIQLQVADPIWNTVGHSVGYKVWDQLDSTEGVL